MGKKKRCCLCGGDETDTTEAGKDYHYDCYRRYYHTGEFAAQRTLSLLQATAPRSEVRLAGLALDTGDVHEHDQQPRRNQIHQRRHKGH